MHAALALRAKLIGSPQHIARLLVEVNLEIPARIRLPTPTIQRGFVVEEVHLTRTAMLKETDDSPRLGTPVRGRNGSGCQKWVPRQQLLKREETQASGRTLQKTTPRQEIHGGVHRR
jgi:hypothetical protein